MTAPAVTIVMPVFNGARDLALAVQSIVGQSFTDWELLLIDDGSTDGAVARLKALSDPRVRVLADGQNKGLAARLNEGVNAARAPLIARMDHDDFAHPERLKLQAEYLSGYPAIDLLGSRCVTMDETDKVFGELPFAETHEEICARRWLGLYLAHPTWMGRTEWFRRNPYAVPSPYACEDQELLLRTAKHSRYHALPAALLAYRVRSTVSPQKLARTRSALLNVQQRYFMSRRMPLETALSTIVFGLRRTSDAMRAVLPRLRSDMRASEADFDRWQALIDHAKASAR